MSAIAVRQALAKVEGESIKTAFKEDAFIDVGEGVKCKARGSVGPETYVAVYFEDHARLRTPQITCYRAPY